MHSAIVPLAAALAAASWLPGAPIPEPRTEVAAAPLRGEIVVVGGLLERGGNSRRADALDPAAGTWRRLPDLPVNVDHAAIASARGFVYVVGGYGIDRAPLRAAYRFDGTRWQRLPPPPEPRAAAAAAATAAGKLYVVGGRDGDSLAATTLVLDLRTLRWSTARGPAPREHLAAAAAGGLVYAIAGRKAGIDTNLATFQALDPRTGRWRTLAPVPEPRGGTGAAAIRGRIVSVGGEEPGGTIESVYAYDLRSRRWQRLPDLPTPRHGLGVVALGGRVWVIAGGPQPGLVVSDAVESLTIP
jgi:non-specific serine/threonine protein kinase